MSATNVTEIDNRIQALEAQLRQAQAERFVASRAGVDPEAVKAAATIQRKAQRLLRYTAKNGVTVEALQKAGNKVTVTHMRMVTVTGKRHTTQIMVPSYMRKTNVFEPRGGATVITITRPDGSAMELKSVCHANDQFDYKMGRKLALEHIGADDLKVLLNPSASMLTLATAMVSDK